MGDYYTPYIYRVKEHWFRNVYFAQSGAEDLGDNIIATDTEYEQETGERWTLYETYEDSSGNQQYELYVYLKERR